MLEYLLECEAVTAGVGPNRCQPSLKVFEYCAERLVTQLKQACLFPCVGELSWGHCHLWWADGLSRR